MNNIKAYWDTIFESEWKNYFENPQEFPEYWGENWLDKHSDILDNAKETEIIDLGCGLGCDSVYLIEKGHKVVSCDISQIALDRLKQHMPNVEVKQFDMLKGMPFENSTAKLVISNLSIHYFSWNDTLKLIGEIRRVLSKDGYFICRVNSTQDIYYNNKNLEELELNFYRDDEKLIRLFDEESIKQLFEGWNIQYINEYEIKRYGKPKLLWEVAVRI